MKTSTKLSIVIVGLAVLVMACASAMADPLPGQFLKFQQLPMDGTQIHGQIYWGHDELSTARANPDNPLHYSGEFMADDFADRVSAPVVHVRWWGSYLNEMAGAAGVQKFLISFEDDVPAGTDYPWSHPGEPIWNQVVKLGPLAPGSGTFIENEISLGGPPMNERLFEYNAELACPFFQEADTVYWLKIVALVDEDSNIDWGWHNRDYTMQNPYASPRPIPGEHVQGVIPDSTGVNDIPIWHFQDDAVRGWSEITEYGTHPCDVEVWQDVVMLPTSYMDGADGPGPGEIPGFEGIGTFSKDLAFELYTIPEPSMFVLIGIGLASLLAYGWRRR